MFVIQGATKKKSPHRLRDVNLSGYLTNSGLHYFVGETFYIGFMVQRLYIHTLLQCNQIWCFNKRWLSAIYMLLSVWVFHGCEDLEHNVIGTRRKQGLYLSFQFFPLPLRSMFNRNGLGISGNLLLTYHHLLYHINRYVQDFLSTSHRLLRCYGNRICLHGDLPRALPRWAWLFFPNYHSSWNESTQNSYTSLSETKTESTTSDTVAIKKSDTGNNEKEKCPVRTAPSTH